MDMSDRLVKEMQEMVEKNGLQETLVDVTTRVTDNRDQALTKDNPECDDIHFAVSAAMTGLTAQIGGDDPLVSLALLPVLKGFVKLFSIIAFPAYCMGYRKGQERGKGLTLVVREEDDQA